MFLKMALEQRMNFQTWAAFVDHFAQSVSRIMPLDGVFSYKIDSAQSQSDYYFQNLSSQLVDEYLSEMQGHDPLSIQKHFYRNVDTLALSQCHIDSTYQEFADRVQMQDNIELFFKINKVPVRGISLIRSKQHAAFSAQELHVIQSCYLLGNYHLNQMLILSNQDMGEKYSDYGLTKKEQQVVDFICLGKSNQAIADAMFVSVPTIKTHVQHIFQKMQVSSRQQVISQFL